MSDFEKQLIYHCAPTLLGIKQANLFSFPSEEWQRYDEEMEKYNQMLNQKDIYFEYLYQCSKRIFILVYRKKPMEQYFQNKEIIPFLETEGYAPNAGLAALFAHLKKRTADFQEFPHEIGFFLGYPPEDVIDYILQKGQNFKLCGYWKVYRNEDKALRIFQNYRKCREVLLKKATAGISILQLFDVA